jgi:type-F conjugative transfer system secretin TraK
LLSSAVLASAIDAKNNPNKNIINVNNNVISAPNISIGAIDSKALANKPAEKLVPPLQKATANKDAGTKNNKAPVLVVLPEINNDVEFADKPSVEQKPLRPVVVNDLGKKTDGVYYKEGTNYAALAAEHKAKESEIINQEKDKQISKPVHKAHKKEVELGAKEVFFADNQQISIGLSNRDINRILVKGDKIQNVNGPTGLYTAKNDSAGAAYISLYGEAPFTLFISTMNGHNVSLLVSPRSAAGKTIILQPTTSSLLSARFEETEGYQKVLIALMSAMINSEASEDYTYHAEKKAKKADFYGIADIKPIASYSGSRLFGIVSEIKNKSKNPLVLKPSYFYKPGVRAASLSKQTIAVGESGILYQVLSRE